MSFFLLAGLTAAIFFVIHLIRLIFCQIEIWTLSSSHHRTLRRVYYNSNNSIEDGDVSHNDNETSPVMSYHENNNHCYFLRDGNTIYGPYSQQELNILGYNYNTLIAVDDPNDWHTAAEIFG